VSPDRVARLAAALDGEHGGAVLERVLGVAVTMLDLCSASVAVVTDGEHGGAVARAGDLSAPVDELQFDLGEGPCVDADRTGIAVLEPDLGQADAAWPAFAAAATAQGIQAAFAFPLRIGAVRMGVLGLYRATSGPLGPVDLGDAVALAGVCTHVLLDAQDSPGALLPGRLPDVLDHRRQVHQATGMVAAQLGLDPAGALARLRARAWADGRPIDDVAADVVGRVLRFREG
jgi:hypothetical protein